MASAPIDPRNAPLEASQTRRIGLRFSNVSGLVQRLDLELRHGWLTVPDRSPPEPGERVMVSLSLPGCQRLLEIPTRVDSVIDGGPNALGAMVLRMTGSAEQVPAQLETFVRECKGERCDEAARNGQPLPRCLLASGNGAGPRKGKRRPSLLDLRIFSRTRSAAEDGEGARDAASPPEPPEPEPASRAEPSPAEAPAPVRRHSTTREQRQLVLNRSKSALLVGDAARAISAGDKAQAQRLLHMALTLDPGNHKARALLRYAEGNGD